MLRISVVIALIGLILGVIGALTVGTSIYLVTNNPLAFDTAVTTTERVVANERQQQTLATLTPTPVRQANSLQIVETSAATPTEMLSPTPAPQIAETETVEVSPTQADVLLVTATLTYSPTTETEQVIITATVIISTADSSVDVRPEAEPNTATPIPPSKVAQVVEYVEPYTSTNQVQAPPLTEPDTVTEAVFSCPTESSAPFDLIPIEGQPMRDHPDFLHADLNLALRGFSPVTEILELRHYNGDTDSNAPRLHGLFEPNRIPEIRTVYQINEWIWDASQCGGTAEGCRGNPVDVFWPVTLAGLETMPGEVIYVPERGPQIYAGGYVALVLYAEQQRITLGYTRRDIVSAGYIIHIENVCIDPNLLALYQAQKNAEGWHSSGFLPALRNNQSFGVAFSEEIGVVIRDAGSFMDPRSHKDWWR